MEGPKLSKLKEAGGNLAKVLGYLFLTLRPQLGAAIEWVSLQMCEGWQVLGSKINLN